MQTVNIQNNSYRTLDIYSGYRPNIVGESRTNFTAILSNPINNLRTLELEYAQFTNNITVFDNVSFAWVEVAYPGFPASLSASFTFPFATFMTPSEVATYIQTQMNSLSPSGFTYTVTIDSSNYFNFTSTGAFSLNCSSENSGAAYLIGFEQVADGFQIYANTVPLYYTPLGTSLRANNPYFLRLEGISILINPLHAAAVNNASERQAQFVVPINSNYGDLNTWSKNSQFNQSIMYFDKGITLTQLRVNIGLMIPDKLGIYNLAQDGLHSDIYLRFTYTTYDDFFDQNLSSNYY